MSNLRIVEVDVTGDDITCVKSIGLYSDGVQIDRHAITFNDRRNGATVTDIIKDWLIRGQENTCVLFAGRRIFSVDLL